MFETLRRNFLLLAAGVVSIAIAGPCSIGAENSPQSQLPNPYQLTATWPTLPAGRFWGATGAIDIDPKGHIWIADRCGGTTCDGKTEDPIMEFDRSGKLLKSFGSGIFVAPHGIYCDKKGNIWITDFQGKNGKGQQVFEFSPDGKVLMTLGKAGVAGDGPDTFNQPDDVVVAPNGEIFVSDGHNPGTGNARVMKFSKDGKFITQWGGHGSGTGQFEVPHALAMDSKGRLIIGDLGNSRLQIFDQNGKFITEWKQFGRASGIFIDQHGKIYVADASSVDKPGPGYNPGFQQGITIGNVKDGKVIAFIPAPPTAANVVTAPEGVAVDRQGTIYGAEVASKNVIRYAKQ
jgi:streptogramin lyase